MIFEPIYARNNRFSQKFRTFIANYNDIKPISYAKEQVASLLNELFTQQARILHKFYFDVVGLKIDHRNSLLVKVTRAVGLSRLFLQHCPLGSTKSHFFCVIRDLHGTTMLHRSCLEQMAFILKKI